jgi:hypothetical protein
VDLYSLNQDLYSLNLGGGHKFPNAPLRLCYHGIDERIRLQEDKLWGIFPGPRGSKNRFLTAVAKLPHNLD